MKRVYSVINALCCGCTNQFHSFSILVARRVILAFIVGGLLAGFTNSALAQTSSTQTKPAATEQPAKAGTYQLIFNTRSGNTDVKLSEYELRAIEKLRSDNEVVYAHATYTDAIRVKILPRNVINAADFKPLPGMYFKDEHPYEEYAHIRYVDLQ